MPLLSKMWFLEPIIWPVLGSAGVLGTTAIGNHFELIHSSNFIEISGFAAATLILFPMGIFRGTCSSMQNYVENNIKFDQWLRGSLKPFVDILPNRNMTGALEELSSLIRKSEKTANKSSIQAVEMQGMKGLMLKLTSKVVMSRYESILDESIKKIIHASNNRGGPSIGYKEGRVTLLDTVVATSKNVIGKALFVKKGHASFIGGSLFLFSFGFILSADYVISLAHRNNKLYGHSYNQKRIDQMKEQDRNRGPPPSDVFMLKVQTFIDGLRK